MINVTNENSDVNDLSDTKILLKAREIKDIESNPSLKNILIDNPENRNDSNMMRNIATNDTEENILENKTNSPFELAEEKMNTATSEIESGCSFNEASRVASNDETRKDNVAICKDKTDAITSIDEDGKNVVASDDDMSDAFARHNEDKKGNVW